MKRLLLLSLFLLSQLAYGQSWQDVGGGTNNSSHGLLTWNGKLIDLGSFNSPCNRVAEWDGTSWSCLGGGVGLVARAGVVWDGKLVVCGDFWNVFQPCVGCNGVAVWDGVSWSPLDAGVNNDVLVCTVWNNQLVIGGDFTKANGVPCSRILKWNPTTTTWESVGPISPTTFSNDIRCMTEFEGELYVGGDFNNVAGCSACDGLVKYDPSTNSWVGGDVGVDIVGGVDFSVRCLYVNPADELLYMGGEFPDVWDGDAAAPDPNMAYIAKYDGSNWTPLGTGLNEYVRAIHEYNGDLIAGGYFTNAGGVPANKIAKWNGTSWSAMGLGFDASGVDEYVKAATVWNGIFFAGGAYTQAEGNPMDHIAQWYEAPTAAPIAWMTASSTTLCSSGCINFLDNSTSGPTSWSWSFPGSSMPTSTLQNPGSVCWSTPGTYTVSLTACNGIGCDTQTIEINVTTGAAVSVSDEASCDGDTVTVTAVPDIGGGTYLWSTGATTHAITVTPSVTTTYTVTYTVAGCAAGTETATVTVGTTPTITVTVSDTILCSGETSDIDITASAPGGNYQWSPGSGGSSETVSPTTTTTYTLQYTLDGCESEEEYVTIVVNPAPTASAVDYTICAGSSVTITSTVSPAGGTYFWTPGGATTSSITVSPGSTQNYNLVYTQGGCLSPVETSTVIVLPSPNIGLSTVGGTITSLQSGAAYQWLDCNAAMGIIAGATSQSYTPPASGTYAVQVSLGGCIDTSACNVIMITGIADANNFGLSIYPNPANEWINVENKTGQILNYEISDVLGKTVLSGPLMMGTSTIDVAKFSKGLYFLKTGKDGNQVMKIVKN